MWVSVSYQTAGYSLYCDAPVYVMPFSPGFFFFSFLCLFLLLICTLSVNFKDTSKDGGEIYPVSTVSSFIHMPEACIRILFFFKAEQHPAICLSIYPSMDIWVVSSFWLLWLCCHEHALQTAVQIPVFSSLGCIPRNGTVGSHNNSVVKFLS